MKKKFLQKWYISFSILIWLGYGLIYACADGGDWGIFYQSNYTPETFVDNTYSPLFLSSDIFYNEDPINNNETVFNDEIVSDWTKYLGSTMPAKDISFFLLDSSSTDVSKIHTYYTSKKANPFSIKWSKKINLEETKTKAFLEFLYLAQQVEKASVANYGSWVYDNYERPSVNNEKFLALLENKYNATTDTFLKNRYWFQTMKAYFYSNYRTKALTFFKKTENQVPKNNLYYRALAYTAGIQYKQKNFALSNYIYSIVFAQCKPMQMIAAHNFHPQNETDWQASLAMAKNNEEKAALWGIQGYYADEEKAIENIYALNPKSEYIDYLLSRIVNSAELKIDNSFKDKSLTGYRKMCKDSVSKSAVALVQKIADENKTQKPYMWNMASGYMQSLACNYNKAETYFDLAEKTMPKTDLSIKQLRLLRFINYVSSLDKIGAAEEKKLLPDLNWLYFELPQKEDNIFRYQNAVNWSKMYIATLFSVNNNTIMNEIFNRNGNYYDDASSLEAMKTFLSKPNKTEFETLATKIYSVTLDDIYEYQAVLATYNNKIDDAISYLQKTEKAKNTLFYGNPFNGKIQDCHDCDHLAKQKRKYSYLDFVTLIKEMQTKVKNNEDAFTNNILLGNAFYNITYYGNARIFYQGNILQKNEFSNYDDSSDKRLYQLMIDCSKATQYYQAAFNTATDDEQRAKAQYMLAKCQRNDFYSNKYEDVSNTWYLDEEKVNFIAWDGFKNLKNKYAHTAFYNDVIRECGYFKTYVSHKN